MTKAPDITPDTFQNILDMANSPDKENQVVALTLVDNLDYKKNLIYILVLKKQATITPELWKEHAPKTCKHMTTSGVESDRKFC